MKKIIILFLTLYSLTVLGQTEAETIKKANNLIANKKYETAFKLLDEFDPTNDKPDIVLLKKDIMLNYFVTSVMHLMFALKDLEPNEDIMDYRGREGTFAMQMFPVDSILIKLIKIHPDNCKLYKGLADYYYEVYLRYDGLWWKEDKELFLLIQTNFQKAIEGNCADYLSYFVLGYIKLVQEKYKESIPYFQKSIEVNKSYASSHYNLAYSYLFIDDLENALKYAKNAVNLYTDKAHKSDVARMLGQIYTELKDDKNALKYYQMANKIDPGNYYNIKPILNLYLKTNNKKASETTKAFFDLDPENPTIYNDLEEVYFRNDKENDLIAFYKSQFPEFKNNAKVQGNLSFYIARIYLEKDKEIAKDYFIKAKDYFEKIFDENHSVFNVIDEGLERCKK